MKTINNMKQSSGRYTESTTQHGTHDINPTQA